MNTAYLWWTLAQGGLLVAHATLATQTYRAMRTAQFAAQNAGDAVVVSACHLTDVKTLMDVIDAMADEKTEEGR